MHCESEQGVALFFSVAPSSTPCSAYLTSCKISQSDLLLSPTSHSSVQEVKAILHSYLLLYSPYLLFSKDLKKTAHRSEDSVIPHMDLFWAGLCHQCSYLPLGQCDGLLVGGPPQHCCSGSHYGGVWADHIFGLTLTWKPACIMLCSKCLKSESPLRRLFPNNVCLKVEN